GPLAANPVGDITGDDGAQEGADGEDGDDERLVAVPDLGGTGVLDGVLEDLGAEHTVGVTGVITEEDTADGGEGAEEVGLPGDGGLDVLDVDLVLELVLGGVALGGGGAVVLFRVGHCVDVKSWCSSVAGLSGVGSWRGKEDGREKERIEKEFP